MEIDENTLDNFWLEGNSEITSINQIEFLRNFYQDQLNLKPSTKSIVLNAMFLEQTKNYKLSGKTGWSIRNGNNYGWFVGFFEVPGNVYFVALNLEPKNQKDTTQFLKSRKEITLECMKKLNLIKFE
jgi:beta-lactamase class D